MTQAFGNRGLFRRTCALFTISKLTRFILLLNFRRSIVLEPCSCISKVKHCCAFVWEIMRILIGMFDRLVVSCFWSSYSWAQNYVTLTKQMRVMRFGWSWKTEYWIRIQVRRQQLDWKCRFFASVFGPKMSFFASLFVRIFLLLYPGHRMTVGSKGIETPGN